MSQRYVAKIWFNEKADKFFGICNHTNDVHVHAQIQGVKDELQSHFTQKITWDYILETNTTKGWITT